MWDPSTHNELIERDGSKTKILVTPTIQWLGIHFDRKLLFNEHVKKLSAKAEAAIGCIAMLSNTMRGLSHLNLCTLYRTCILPIMTYASPIWWRKKEIHAKALRQVQNRALRIICAAFRTMPTQALEVKAAIPPIHLHLDYLERKAGIRLNRLSITNPVLHRLPPAWSHSRYSTYQQSTDHPSKGSTQLLRIAAHTDHTHEQVFPFLLPPWRKTHADYSNRVTIQDKATSDHLHSISPLKTSPNHTIVYTDGSQKVISKRIRRTGAAAVGFHQGKEIFKRKIGLGGTAEVYDAELTGLALGLKAAISSAEPLPEIHHIHIYADNTSAITSVIDPQPQQGQLLAHSFYQNMLQWLEKKPTNTLTIAWCPGHKDIPGNDRADQLAKQATSLASLSEPTATYNLRQAQEHLKDSWTTIWRNTSPQQGSWSTANQTPSSLHPPPHFLELADKRELFGRPLQCRIGHGYIGEYYQRFVPSANPACPCGKATQTRDQSCPTYEEYRTILHQASQTLYLPDLLGTKDGIQAMASFLEKYGAFTKNGHSPPTPSPPHITDRTLIDFIATDSQTSTQHESH